MTSQFEQLPPEEAREAVRGLLLEMTRQLDVAIHALAEGTGVGAVVRLAEHRELIETILLMVQGVGVSIHSIIKLTDTVDMGIRDCFGIARSACEGAINVAYIIASGPEMANRARRHAMQKAHREIGREVTIGGLRVGARLAPPPEQIPGMVEALAEFTRKNGTEVSDWAPHNLVEKQGVIKSRFPGVEIAITASIAGLYRNASEILHGTFYGVQYFWTGGFSTGVSKTEFIRSYVDIHLVSIFTSVWASTTAMLEVISTEYDIPELSRMRREWLGRAAKLFVPVP